MDHLPLLLQVDLGWHLGVTDRRFLFSKDWPKLCRQSWRRHCYVGQGCVRMQTSPQSMGHPSTNLRSMKIYAPYYYATVCRPFPFSVDHFLMHKLHSLQKTQHRSQRWSGGTCHHPRMDGLLRQLLPQVLHPVHRHRLQLLRLEARLQHRLQRVPQGGHQVLGGQRRPAVGVGGGGHGLATQMIFRGDFNLIGVFLCFFLKK